MHCAVYSRFIVCWVFRNDLVLVSRNGKVLSNAQLRRVLDRVLRKANIDKPFTLHQLRHTFATRTLKAGVPISVVSKWLGHANISTTYNTYIPRSLF